MVLDAGRIKHLGDYMHKSIASNGSAITSNWRLSADGLTNVVWSPESTSSVSYGSNANDVGYTDAPGASSLVSRADHVHRGVTSLSHASNTYTGPVTLETEGGLYIVRPSVNTFRLGSTSGTGGGGSGGPSDYVSGPASSGQIIIPGLYGSPDIRVAGTNDDEFDTTDTSDPMTGWTTLGTPTAHDINSTVKSHYRVRQAATSSVGLVGIYKAIPSTPFTVTCKLTDWLERGDFNQAGLFIAEAAPGKIETLAMKHSGSPGGLAIDTYTNRTTYATTPQNLTVYMTAGAYLRCVVTTTTSISWYYSFNGLVWRPILTGRNPGFTVGNAGLYCGSVNATYDAEALFDWIRFT
jgi:hypothetical protein